MSIKRILLILAGCTFTAIGAIGLILPVLPTTPFVLVASACFTTSSPKLYTKLINNRYLGEFIRNYREKTGITKKTRVYALVFLWFGLIISGVSVNSLIVRLTLLIVGIGVSIHLINIKGIDNG